ncbi:putative pyridoxamine 5'-phosphate oxidase [Podospora fimiseda]|uniref:pyridoxal 5'-phosphate synthase n=1 Tax=Podospora fimiseda TaxID=252190 RepID=A0AAN7H3R6_9PEZI|nr:putative pyridoxamine 5'-phosphate oxidase [Podospora fimiseda]
MSLKLPSLPSRWTVIRGTRNITISRMALHAAHDKAKLIFAPSGTPVHSGPGSAPGQAAQFLKTERLGGLKRSDLDRESPITQFHNWFNQAVQPESGVSHAETCTLSTAQLPSGRVSSRVVYLKELDPKGFVIYSNFGTSGKARDLFGTPDGKSTGNRWASMVFWWEPLERQVRVEGRAERLTAEESQVYYDTRVRGSRIGAWASKQSSVLKPREDIKGDDGRSELNNWVKETEQKFEGVEKIPVPEFWGGLRIVPERIEFWQGRENRLHDRFVYERVQSPDGDEKWTLDRLSP